MLDLPVSLLYLCYPIQCPPHPNPHLADAFLSHLFYPLLLNDTEKFQDPGEALLNSESVVE